MKYSRTVLRYGSYHQDIYFNQIRSGEAVLLEMPKSPHSALKLAVSNTQMMRYIRKRIIEEPQDTHAITRIHPMTTCGSNHRELGGAETNFDQF